MVASAGAKDTELLKRDALQDGFRRNIFLARPTNERKARAEAEVAKLSDSDPEIQRRAVVALVDEDQIGIVPESALKPLLLLVHSKDSITRMWTISAFGKLGPKYADQTKPLILAALKDDRDVAIAAAVIVGLAKFEEGVQQLSAMTKSDDMVLRDYSAEALSRIGTEEAKSSYLRYVRDRLPELLAALESSDEAIAADANIFISKMGISVLRLGLTNTPEGEGVIAARKKAEEKAKEQRAKMFSE